jgi:hypothetical protein
MPDPVYMLGKLPKQDDERNLMLTSYLTPAAPTPPPAVDYAAAVTAWGMLGNDRVGDCALAGEAHADMLWVANAEHRALAITTAQVLRAYSALTGYDPQAGTPGANPTDRGTVLLDALKDWRTRGIDRQTISAFVEVDTRSVADARLAIDLFGCLYVGVELPDAVLPEAPGELPQWTVVPDGTRRLAPNPRNGHCVIYAGYDEAGPTVVTWGTTVKASWEFHKAYCDELYAMLSPAWLRHDPPGIDVVTLTADLALVARR